MPRRGRLRMLVQRTTKSISWWTEWRRGQWYLLDSYEGWCSRCQDGAAFCLLLLLLLQVGWGHELFLLTYLGLSLGFPWITETRENLETTESEKRTWAPERAESFSTQQESYTSRPTHCDSPVQLPQVNIDLPPKTVYESSYLATLNWFFWVLDFHFRISQVEYQGQTRCTLTANFLSRQIFALGCFWT